MSVIEIREARRQGARLVVGLQGISGSGKTLTALYLAWGLANYDASKVGFLDTENRRGSLYADALKDSNGEIHRFLIGDLAPPFSPDRYVQAIQEFEKAGVEVLVIDSVSHEWAGQGGCYDIAKNTTKRIDDWLTAKNEHKRFMSAMLQSPMHIIPCIREAPKTDFKDPKNPKSLGLMPIQESQFVFELTASLQMHAEGKAQSVLKCPDELRGNLGRCEGYITPADGKALRDWVDGAITASGGKKAASLERWRSKLQMQTEKGLAHVVDCWEQTDDKVRKALGEPFRAQLFAAAEAFDKAAAGACDQDLDELNSSLLDQADNDAATTTADEERETDEREQNQPDSGRAGGAVEREPIQADVG